MKQPLWWTDTDSAIVQSFRDWQIGRRADLPPNVGKCRQCYYWQSEDGKHGDCTMPVTPSTVNCGTTEAHQGCEQWDAR